MPPALGPEETTQKLPTPREASPRTLHFHPLETSEELALTRTHSPGQLPNHHKGLEAAYLRVGHRNGGGSLLPITSMGDSQAGPTQQDPSYGLPHI